jgi:hypothetical protein
MSNLSPFTCSLCSTAISQCTVCTN